MSTEAQKKMLPVIMIRRVNEFISQNQLDSQNNELEAKNYELAFQK